MTGVHSPLPARRWASQTRPGSTSHGPSAQSGSAPARLHPLRCRTVWAASPFRACELAADASRGIEIHHAVVAPIEGSHRADRHARRVLAVVAAHHREETAAIGKGPLLDVFHPSAIDADGNLVLALARHRARVAADALA